MSARILDALISANKVPLYLDFRTGSLRDLGGMGNHPTVTSCVPVTAKGRRGINRQKLLGTIECADTASLRLSQLSMACLLNNSVADPIGTNPRVLARTENTFTNVNYDIYYSPAAVAFGIQSGAPFTATAATMTLAQWVAARSVGASAGASSVARLFLNASLLPGAIGTTTIVSTGAGMTTRVGWLIPGMYGLDCLHALVLVNEQLDDADMCRLMRELEAAPGVVARARNHFSIPYPSKTPAQYAAAGITCDIPGRRVGYKPMDLVTGTRPSATSPDARMDVSNDGPFDGSLRADELATMSFDSPVGNPPLGRSEWTLMQWATPSSAAIGTYWSAKYIGTPYFVIEETGVGTRDIRFAVNDTTGAISAYSASRPAGEQTLCLACVYGTSEMQVYLNGVASGAPVDNTAQLLTINNPWRLSVAGLYTGAPYFVGKHHGFRMFDHALTPAEIRAEYLLGARKCLLDGRLHRDGSCPVSLANIGPGNKVGPWTVVETVHRIQEAAPSGSRPGKRTIVGTGGGITHVLSTPDGSAFGSWYIEVSTISSTGWMPVASVAARSTDAAQNGYIVNLASNLWVLYRVTAGASAPILILDVGGPFTGLKRIWLTRRYDGLWSFWAQDETTYLTWTLLGTSTDTTHVTSNYQIREENFEAAKTGDMLHFLGEMTPTEAIALGLIEP